MRGLIRWVKSRGWLGYVVVALPATVAIWAGWMVGHRSDRGAVAFAQFVLILVVNTVALTGTFRGWHRRRRVPAAPATVSQLTAAADALAAQLLAVWSREVVSRGIQSPMPVRVRWLWASDDLGIPQHEINAAGVGTDPPRLPGVAVEEKILGSGLVTRLHDRVYARLRHGRLVVTGGPGAGKTGAMILLLLEALQHRRATADAERARVPVPVWLTPGSWNPWQRSMREWVAAVVAQEHPYLKSDEFGPDAIGRLIDSGQVALFIDGLDEMPADRARRVLERLAAEGLGLRIVLTSRCDDYRELIGSGCQLPYAAVVELQPVGATAAAEYLVAGQLGAARSLWTQVADQVRAEPDGTLATLLNRPLTLSLARSGGDPAWLLDTTLKPAEVEERLLDQVLVRAYPDPAERAHATYWLGWIADHLGTPRDRSWTRDLRWWDIPSWTPRGARRLLLNVLTAAGTGVAVCLTCEISVAGWGVDPWLSLLRGLQWGLAAGFSLPVLRWIKTPGKHVEPRKLALHRPSWRELRRILGESLSVSLRLGVAFWGFVIFFSWGACAGDCGSTFLTSLGLLVGALFVGLAFGFVPTVAVKLFALFRRPLAEAQTVGPGEVYRNDRLLSRAFGVTLALSFLIVVAFPDFATVGTGPGLIMAFAYTGGPADQLAAAELLQRLRRKPVRFMPLLETALSRQVLRQTGSIYQFRHAELQDRLADQHRQATSGPGPVTRS